MDAMPDTWTTRELPILEAVLKLEEADTKQVRSSDLARMAGLTDAEARRAWAALAEDGYVRSSQMLGGSFNQWVAVYPRLRGKGRRAVKQWPADGYDALLAALDERIAAAEPAEQSKLVRFRDGLIGMGRDVAVDVLGALFKAGAGL